RRRVDPHERDSAPRTAGRPRSRRPAPASPRASGDVQPAARGATSSGEQERRRKKDDRSKNKEERAASAWLAAPSTAGLRSAFDQPDLAGARTFSGFFGRELHPLPLAQQLEHGAADGAAMKEVLDTALVADESEPLVDQESSDRPGWHTRVLRCTAPPGRSRRLTSRAQENTTS